MPARLSRRPTPCIEGLERRLCLTTLYVAPGGLDVNPGTQGAALASLAGAATVARAGDVVYVMAGVYSPNNTQLLTCVGAPNGHITFESYPGQTAVIDGAGMSPDSSAVNIAGAYIDFQNFEVRNARGAAVQVTGQHIQVIANTLDGAQRQGVLVGSGSSLSTTGDVFIESNYITNDDLAAVSGTAASGPPAP